MKQVKAKKACLSSRVEHSWGLMLVRQLKMDSQCLSRMVGCKADAHLPDVGLDFGLGILNLVF